MKKFFLVTFSVFFITYFASAQSFETSEKSIPVVVPLEKAPEVNTSGSLLLSPQKSKESPFMKTPEKQIDFTGKSNLIRRKVEIKPNILQREEGYEVPKRDIFFGDFTVDGDIILYCRDFGAIDGDRISIIVNGKVEIHDILMLGEYQGFQVFLKPGFNNIEFIALNQGEYSPNTADFKIVNNKGVVTQGQWNLATGSKAQFVIIKNVENQE